MPSWSHVICIKHCLHLTLFCPRGALQINSVGFTELWQLFFDPLCCLLTLLGMFKPSLKWMATLIMLSLLLWLLNSPQTIITGKIRALLQYSLPLSIDPCSAGKSWQQQACCGQLQQCPAVCQGDFAYSLAWKKNKLCCNKSWLHKFYLHAEKPFKISGKDLIFKKKKKKIEGITVFQIF